MNKVTPYLRLPFSFDVSRLKADLAVVAGADWLGHFNTGAYEKGWSCLALRSVNGSLDHIMPLEDARFADTPLLAQCPYFQEVINGFECEKTSIRLMALQAGGVILEHRDSKASLEDGVTRLHIPVQTAPEVLFRIEGETVHFSAGHAWYLNASCLHGVENRSSQARVHLMIDCVTNPWLERVFQAAGGVLREASPYGDDAIHDGNVQEVIAALLSSGHHAGMLLAGQLRDTHARRQAAGPRH